MIHLEEWGAKSKKGRSRREFLSTAGIVVFMLSSSFFFMSSSNKMKDEDEYIFINGWLLKKEDLNDI